MSTNRTMDKETTYIETIREAYPGLDVHSARLHTRDGQFNDILFINEALIFRFPRYRETISDFLGEVMILQKLQGNVSLPIPYPIYTSSSTAEVGRVFMGYEMIPGKPLFREALEEITSEHVLESFARQLAHFLYGLHTLSLPSLGLDLPIGDGLAESKTFYSNVREHLFPFMRPEARAAVSRHFEDYFDNARLHSYEPALIHGDFGGSNILFDEDKLTGIIDFGFARLDDPARDIAAVSTYGEAFLARIRRHYPNVEPLLERAQFYRGTFALYEALHGLRNNDRDAFESGLEEYV